MKKAPNTNFQLIALLFLKKKLANSPVGAKADKTQDMLIIEAVEKFFLDTVGQYKRYLHKGVNGEFTFNRKQFIKQSPRSVRLVHID
jgi:hypothetical protein